MRGSEIRSERRGSDRGSEWRRKLCEREGGRSSGVFDFFSDGLNGIK